jgi:N-acetylmuramoyl-L-alanine amidase
VPYVSLSQLVEQMGGKARLDGPKVEIALGGAKALAGINDTAVTAGKVQFALAHPVVTEYENAYISVEDAARFFEQGFQVALTRSDSVSKGNAIVPSTPEEAPAETEDPKALLKTMELPPPPAPAPAPDTTLAEPSPTAPPITPAETTATPAPAVPAVPQAVVSKGPIKHVAVDAGHGGGDTGTMGPNGTAEKAITAAMAARFEKARTETGALSAAQTRKEDKEISIGDRVSAAVAQSAGLLVSLHTGAALSPQAPLIQIYHSPVPAEGGDLAACAIRAKAVADAMGKALAEGADAPTVTVRALPLRLQTAAKMPCLLIELASLNQADGEALLVAEDQRGPLVDRTARALAAALASVNAQR